MKLFLPLSLFYVGEAMPLSRNFSGILKNKKGLTQIQGGIFGGTPIKVFKVLFYLFKIW